MHALGKLGLVIGGYAAACVAAYGVVYVYEQLTQTAAAQASAGMFAFGDLLLFLSVFGCLALFPTGLGLYFLIRKFTSRA